MFCNKCGSEIPNGSKFCSICGAPVAAPAAAPAEPAAFTMPAGTERAGITPEPAAFAKPAAPAPAPAEPEPAPRRTMFEDINWNVNEYPDRNTVEKTEDVDFNWGADPNEIKDRYTRGFSGEEAAVLRGQTAAPASTGLNVEDLVPGGMRQPQPEPAYQEQPFSSRTPLFDDTDIFGKPAQAEGASLSAADKIDKFYTFSSKNEEFQQLLNREYDKIKGGNVIGQEQSQADKTAAERFETRTQDPSMEAFLEREGVVKPYEPKPVQTDVLERIEAQDQARERERLEQEERARALEEARLQAEAEIRAAAEAKAKAEEEARLAAEEEARIRAEEELRMRQAEEAKARAEEEARLAAEEAARAEEEARKAAAEEARLLAEEEARRKEEAEKQRLEALAQAKAQREAEMIKAQHEARLAAQEEEKEKLRQERAALEVEQQMAKAEARQEGRQMEAGSAAAAEEARKALAQTARMREEEAAKIRAAIASLKGETAPEPAPVEEAKPFFEPAPAPAAEPTPEAAPAAPAAMFAETFAAEPAPAPVFEPAKPAPAPIAEPAPTPVQTAPAARPAAPAQPQTAHEAQLSEMAKARAEFLAEFGLDAETPAAPAKPAPAPVQPAPATVEELLGEKPVTSRESMLNRGSETADTRVIKKADVLSGMDATIRISKEELKAVETIPAADFEAPAPILKYKEEPATVEEMLAKLEAEAAAAPAEPEIPEYQIPAEPEIPEYTAPVEPAVPEFAEPAVPDFAEPAAPAPEQLQEDVNLAELFNPVVEGYAAKEEPGILPGEEAIEGDKPGLENTMVMAAQPIPEEAAANAAYDPGYGSFDSYGEAEAEEYRRQQEAAAAAAAAMIAPAVEPQQELQPQNEDIFAEQPIAPAEQNLQEILPAAEEPVDKKAAKKAAKEAKKAEKEARKAAAEEQQEKGGAGRVILKILLIILIIIFALELTGIGIKFLAPNSSAASFIDDQLNKVIQLITGSQPDYTIPGIEYKA